MKFSSGETKMRKIFFWVFCFSMISSAACAGLFGRTVMMAEEFAEFSRRSMSTMRITTGFRPEVQPPIVFQRVAQQRRVFFLDDNHEFYVPLDESLVSTPEKSTLMITKEDNHSVRVDLNQKKK